MTVYAFVACIAIAHAAIVVYAIKATAAESIDYTVMDGNDWEKIDKQILQIRKRLDGSPTKRAYSCGCVYDRSNICDRTCTQG